MTRSTIRCLSALLLLCLIGTAAGANTPAEAKAAQAEADKSKAAAATRKNTATTGYEGCYLNVKSVTDRYNANYSELQFLCTETEWADLHTALYAAWNYGSAGDTSFGYGEDGFSDGTNWYGGGETAVAEKDWNAAVASFGISHADYGGADYHYGESVTSFGLATEYADAAKAILDRYVP